MRPGPVPLTVAAWLTAAAPSFSQSATITSGAGTYMSARANEKSATITINMGARNALPTRTGAPYSGREVSKTVRTLPDGTQLTGGSLMSTTTYRDSMGRLRTERPAFPARSRTRPLPSFAMVEIQDPVAGFRYFLDSVNRVSYRVPLQSQVVTPPPPGAKRATTVSSARTQSDGTAYKSESLGTQVISGVVVEGIRTTTTHPAGSFMGNDRPVTTVRESWSSPQLGLTLLSKSTDPNGESTTTWEDFSTSEPDPALFMIPSNYQEVEYTEPFTIIIPRENVAR